MSTPPDPITDSTQPSVTIRPAIPADAATVHSLVLDIAELEGDLEHVHVTVEGWARILGRSDVTVLLAERHGQVLGYVSATRRLHLWSGRDLLAVDDVFVREHARGSGIGRQLLVAMATTVAAEELTIAWGMEPENTGAQRFYRCLGATLRPKIMAGWAPTAYLPLVHAQTTPEMP